MMKDVKAHTLSPDELLKLLGSDPEGLDEEEARRRLELYGRNLIVGIVIVNALIGFFQEYRALVSLESLKKYTELTVRVLRNGKPAEQPSSLLVPGDVVLLQEGDVVPADLRLLRSEGLLVDESVLTGESIPAEKIADLVLTEEVPLYERRNIAFKGTLVVRGYGVGVVYATILFLLFLIGILQGRSIYEVSMLVIAELVSAVPEGLPIVITLVLVVGAIRLSRRKTYIRYLPAAETLGSTTYIAADKTGTITEGKLRVAEVHTFREEDLILVSALCNNSDGEKGDPVEVALLRWLEERGVDWRALREK